MRYDRVSANRAFFLAVLASLLAHALLLLVDWPFLKTALPRPVELFAPLVARLVEIPAPASQAPPSQAPPPQAPRVEKPAPVREKPTPPRPIAKPAPRPVAKPAPRPAAKPAPAPKRPSRTIEAPVAAAPSAPATAPAPAPAPPATAIVKEAPAVSEAELKDQYRAALIEQAKRFKRYPPIAIDNGWEGDVVVRMVIAVDGALASLSIESSSGHAVLDRRALEMFRRAKPGVDVPPALRGTAFAIELRAVFDLEDQTSG